MSIDADEVRHWPPAYRDSMRTADVLVVTADFIRKRMQAALGRQDVEVAYCFSRKLQAAARAGCEIARGVRVLRPTDPGEGIDWIQRLSADPRLAGVRWKLWGSEAHYKRSDFAAFGNIDYEGSFTDETGLRAALAALDCFVLLSATEGLPLSLMEVMGAGKPWIATAAGGIPSWRTIRIPACS